MTTTPIRDLPTEPGSVILVTECRGERVDEPVVAMLSALGDWGTPAHQRVDSCEGRPGMTALVCACATNLDGSKTATLCPLHGETDPCFVMAQVTGRRRKGSIIQGTCSNCGWEATR